MPGRLPLAAKAVIAIVLIVVFMEAYWHAVIPSYLKGMDLCANGCHQTVVLAPENISGPFWCAACHGFGVKSELIKAITIPRVRVAKLEALLDKHGECVMCHRIPGDFHWKHLNATKEDLLKYGLYRPIECVDCHEKAYKGGHTLKPGDKVCVKCHHPEKEHPAMNKEVIAHCLLCHSEHPAINCTLLKPGKASYKLANEIGARILRVLGRPLLEPRSCMVCHNKPVTEGHVKHYGKKYRPEAGVERRIGCTDCHKKELKHGKELGVEICVDCHKPEKTKFHEEEFEALLKPYCNKCHAGFAYPNQTLMPVKGCEGCHGRTYITSVMMGLHSSHLKVYGSCFVCHKANVTAHKEFVESVERNTTKLCLKCHEIDASLKPEALENVTKAGVLVLAKISGSPYHAAITLRAKGNCLSCHPEWVVTAKPKLIYYYATPPWPVKLPRKG